MEKHFLGRNLFVGKSSNVLCGHIFTKVPLDSIEGLQAFNYSATGIPVSCAAMDSSARPSKDAIREHWSSSSSFHTEPVALLLIGRKTALQYYTVDYPALMKAEYETESLYWHNKRY